MSEQWEQPFGNLVGGWRCPGNDAALRTRAVWATSSDEWSYAAQSLACCPSISQTPLPCLSTRVDVAVCSKHTSYTGSAPASHSTMCLCFLSPSLT